MHNRQSPLFFLLLLFFFGCSQNEKTIYNDATVIKGGTILNLENNGKNTTDWSNKAIIVQGDTIAAVIDVSELNPKQKNIIDATGKYIMPGLTDGFTVINNQQYANAFLYMGVTDVVGVESERRGPFYHDSDPSPNVHMLREVGEERMTNQQILDTIAKHHNNGAEVLLMMYKLTPDQVALAHKEAKKYGMGTIGELGFTSYKEAMDIGVDAFVHTTRYTLDVAPDTLAEKVAEQPFSNDLGSPKWRYYKMLTEMDSTNEALISHAKNLGESGSYIQPTFALLYLDMPFSKNPWKERVATIINIADVNRPADKETGKHNYPPEELAAYQKLGHNELMIERLYHRNGARYLSGSATDVLGSMPGISLHQELEVLHRIGLTNREVLAASTSNFNDAYGFKFGKIKPGFKANILMLKENPLEDLALLKGEKRLWVNGQEIDIAGLIK